MSRAPPWRAHDTRVPVGLARDHRAVAAVEPCLDASLSASSNAFARMGVAPGAQVLAMGWDRRHALCSLRR